MTEHDRDSLVSLTSFSLHCLVLEYIIHSFIPFILSISLWLVYFLSLFMPKKRTTATKTHKNNKNSINPQDALQKIQRLDAQYGELLQHETRLTQALEQLQQDEMCLRQESLPLKTTMQQQQQQRAEARLEQALFATFNQDDSSSSSSSSDTSNGDILAV